MKGALASLARRRAISVLPTPVGPIMRMFLGTISLRRGAGTCWRRQRLRSATATERLARFWPTMFLSSSETISPGVILVADMAWALNGLPGLAGGRPDKAAGRAWRRLQGFDDVILVGVDAQVAGDLERFLDDLGRRQVGVLQQGQGGRLGIGAARADGGQAVLGLQYVAVAGQHQRMLAVGHDKHGFQPAQYAVGAPVAGQLHCGAHQAALVFFKRS